MTTRRPGPSTREQGQALVELALVLPLFIVLLLGIFDFGRAVYAYNTVLNASREGARQAIVDQTLAHVRARAAGQAVNLSIDPATVDVDYRQAASPDVQSSCDANLGTPRIMGCTAVVRVQHTYDAATPLIGLLVGQITVTGETRFPVEHDCQEPTKPTCPLGG